MNQAGKGDTPRPVNGDKFRSNYERIFEKHHATNPVHPDPDDSEKTARPRLRHAMVDVHTGAANRKPAS